MAVAIADDGMKPPLRNPGRKLRVTRDAVAHLVARDYRLRHKRAFFGWLWSVGQPLLRFAGFSFFFSQILGIKIPNYPAYLFFGLVSYTWFASGVPAATTAFLNRPDLLFRNNVPRIVMPVVAVLVESIDFVAALPILLIVVIASGLSIGAPVVLLPVLFLLQLVFILAIGLLCCSWNMRVRDVKLALDVVLLAWLYATPVFYKVDAVPGTLRNIVEWNPLTVLLTAERDVLLENRWPDGFRLAVIAAVSVGLLVASLAVFRRMSPKFIDQV